VVEAVDGVEGLERLADSSPDLVVLDVQMPRLDGWETLKGIRSRSDIPVLMLTAEATEADRVRVLVDGADDCVAKPLSPDDFVARIRALLERSDADPGVRRGAQGDDSALEAGERVGNYRIESLIAHGGMSSVYRATHTAMDRTVALKLLSRELAADHVTRERFQHEWRVAGALRHPNIIPVHDAGEVDGHLFLVMDLIEAGDLGHLISHHGALSPPRALTILSQAAAALDAAHAAGLVHRDVKPGNILVDGEHAYLTDFGLSKTLASNRTRLTAPGRMVGTAEYLSPEQIRGEQVDARTDVYALGCVMFESLTASSPFDADSDYVMMFSHLEQEVPGASERRPALPPTVDEVIAKAMAKQPEDRFATAGGAVAALRDAFGYE
jgi:serine/threonine protein kinase/CheY-like chemotaxis protein